MIHVSENDDPIVRFYPDAGIRQFTWARHEVLDSYL